MPDTKLPPRPSSSTQAKNFGEVKESLESLKQGQHDIYDYMKTLATNQKDISSHVHTLQDGQREITGRVNVLEKSLCDEIAEMKQELREMKRTLRGHNGSSGVITQIEIIRNKIDTMAEQIKKNAEGAKVANDTWEYLQRVKSDGSSKDELFISFRWIIDRIGVPLIISVIVFILFTLIPLATNMVK